MSPGVALVLPGRFRAVVFDLDGLLMASEPVWQAAERELLARHGAVYTADDRLATRGRSVDESIRVYGARIGVAPDLLPELRAELIDLFRSRIPSVLPLPGATRLVRSLAGWVPLAVASSSPRSLVDDEIVAAGLAGAFDVTLTGDDVARNKPAPDIYALACRRLGADPADVIAFEDSGPGVRAATGAGLFCVAVQPDPEIDVSGADLVVSTLEAVAVEAPTRVDPR